MPEVSQDNRVAVAKDVADSLTRAGIGRRYHTRGLSDFGELGNAVKARMMIGGNLFVEMESGKNFIVKGKSSYDFSLVLAKALLISTRPTRVTSPIHLASLFDERRHNDIDDFESVGALVLTSFSEAGDNPMSPWQRRRVEGLLNARLDACRVTTVQVEKPGTLGWWSPSFVERFTATAEILEVR